MVSVYQLSPSAVYFWGQLPPFKRAKKTYSSAIISLDDLTQRFKQEKFSGFIDTHFNEENESGLIFFNDGERLGGSFSWGSGGLSQKHEDYTMFLEKLATKDAVFQVGKFLENKKHLLVEAVDGEAQNDEEDDDPIDNVGLVRSLEEFLSFYTIITSANKKQDPLLLLRQSFINHVDKYPFLDPFKGQFTYVDGIVEITDYSQLRLMAQAVVECVWEIISELGMQDKFTNKIENWETQILKDMGLLEGLVS